MREILFRGKRIDDDEWVEGSPIIYSNGICVICNEYVRNENVILETVGQYTGLTDDNGKKIFEGDIVKFRLGEYSIVKYDELLAMFTLKNLPKDIEEDFPLGVYCTGYSFEVIGNIHDNPELLKENNNGDN